ncbi:MAG: hypothetical protein Q4B09_06290 [Lachnospiraceae bacterium]|nr:hypothetical protein [Lachnospiraceae bacterium]
MILLLLALVLAGSGIYLYRREMQEQAAGAVLVRSQNESVLSVMTSLIPEETAGTVASAVKQSDQEKERAAQTLPMLEIDGFSCVGILTFEKQKLTWAVVNIESDTEDCYLPVAVSGHPADGDLIIRGFDHKEQFAALQKTEPGERVTFRDINGVTYHYAVTDTVKLDQEQVRKTLAGQSTGLILTGEAMRRTDDIALQLYYEIGEKYRFVVDCCPDRTEN